MENIYRVATNSISRLQLWRARRNDTAGVTVNSVDRAERVVAFTKPGSAIAGSNALAK
jgi:hypothetical protein